MKFNTKTLLILTAALVVLTAIVLLFAKPTTYAPTQEVSGNLDKEAASLDEENVDSFDSELNQLDSDSSSF